MQQDREIIDKELQTLGVNWTPANAGELNFVVSTFMANYIREKGLKYANLNEMVGALECAKMELNRVIIGQYEYEKIQENGGVYDGIFKGPE